MRIHVLAENSSMRADLQAEHGLSLYIETEEHRILFDMGASNAFALNAEKMGVDISAVDIAVLSHGHYDHGGGLPTFLQMNNKALIYANTHVFERHFNATGKEIGLCPHLVGHPRIHHPETDIFELTPHIKLHSSAALPRIHETNTGGMTTERGGKREKDDFRHEQYLLVQENNKRILISGCSHCGILNIATHFCADVLVGGFHFMRAHPNTDTEKLRTVAHDLGKLPTRYYTGHCTGEYAFGVLKETLGAQLSSFSTGMILEI